MRTTTLLLLLGGTVTLALLATRPAWAQGQQAAAWRRYVSLEMVDDGTGRLVPTLRVTGANFQIVNGQGVTDQVDGSGNLIVGYRAPTGDPLPLLSGSHGVVIGDRHEVSSYGSLVSGTGHRVSGSCAVAVAGNDHLASGISSSIWGGRSNEATGVEASLRGGVEHVASGECSSVSGAARVSAWGFASSVSGGGGPLPSIYRFNSYAIGAYSSMTGGQINSVGELASISGGLGSRASGHLSSVSGGLGNLAAYADGELSSISGGYDSRAHGSAFAATLSGGSCRNAFGQLDWVAGGLFEDD